MTKKFYDTIPPPLHVVLVGIICLRQNKQACQTNIEELSSLARTAGLHTVKEFIQKRDYLSKTTMIGKGKVTEIGAYVKKNNIDRVIFDDELTPLQVRNLEKAWQCTVWDRSLLILDIFARHARTPQAKAQVELAQYQYLLPRLVGMWTHLSRQRGGGSNMRGPGEKELETDRRAAQKRIQSLKKRLTVIEKTNKNQHKKRYQKTNITLVGYTNAGKSSLMQRLAKENVLVADKLFATLSPTVRQIMIKGHTFLLTDTVGFIHKLPHTLVECFKSTLAEVHGADFLLHIVDFSHPAYEHHIHVVQQVLQEIEAAKVPSMLVLNKQDLAIVRHRRTTPEHQHFDPNVFLASETQRIASSYAIPTVVCSATEKKGLENLKQTLYHSLVSHHIIAAS